MNVARRGAEHAADAPPRPTRAELFAAAERIVPDVIAPDLRVLFCGINPGLYSAAIGHHFGRPGNRFWPAIYQAGITPRLLSPHEDGELLTWGYGITNIVQRATAAASELAGEELSTGGRILTDKVIHFGPRILAVLGVTAYRSAFARRHAALGLQSENIGDTIIWVLPNPSGLNAHFSLAGLAQLFRELRQAAENG